MGCGASSGDNAPILVAIAAGNEGKVRTLIRDKPGQAVLAKGSDGNTVVHIAVMKEPGSESRCLAAVLEASGTDFNAANKAGQTPVQVAGLLGKEVPFRALIRTGAKIEDPAGGETALHLAAAGGHAKCLQAALDCGATLDAQNGKKQTPLLVAAAKGHLACVQVLLSKKVDGAATVDGQRPSPRGDQVWVDDMGSGRTALHEAAANGHKDVVEALLKGGANSQVKSSDGKTAAQLAQEGGHRAVADKLGAAPKEEDILAGKAVAGGGGGAYVDGDPEGLTPASEDTCQRVQELMDRTWKGATTRDRSYGKVNHFQVVQVIQNSNKALWDQYAGRRDQLSLHYVEKLQDIKTVIDSWEQSLQEPRRLDCNEFFLFHGTKPTAARAICEGGFRVDLSGSNKGTLYGPGIYCAESSAKADEYAGDDEDGLYKGLFAMLICRVSLGNAVYNEEVQPDVAEIQRLLESDDKHSVVGDREKLRGTYREFIFRDAKQCYPAYAIIYKRRESTEEEAAGPSNNKA